MIMRKRNTSSAGKSVLFLMLALRVSAQPHLWDAEPSLWDAAQQFTLTRPLPTETNVGSLNIEGASNNVPASSLGINLSNGELKIALSGAPANLRLTVSKTDIWDRGGDGMQKGAGNLTLAFGDFAGAAQPQVATSIHNGVHALTLSKGAATANLKFLCTRRETNTMAIKAECSNIANAITINISRTNVTSGSDGQFFWINRSFKADKTFPNGFQYYFVGKVSGATANVQISNGQAVISPGPSLSFTVYATVVTTAEAADPLAEAKRLLTSAATQGFDTLTAGNQAWFKALYQRREQGRIFTGNFEDIKKYILPYYFQGSWQNRHTYWSSPDPTKFEGDAIYSMVGSDTQPWGGLPCFNEELYTGDFVAGLDESIAPYYVKIYNYWLPGFKLNAKARGKPGASNFRGYIPPVAQHQYQNGYGPDGPWDYCTMGWGFKNVWDEFDYGGRDDAFLRDSVYPALSGMADFMAASVVSRADGYYHIQPSMVREQDIGRDAMDCVAAIKWFYKRAIQAAKILGVDADKQTAWQERLDKMAPYYTLSDGRWAAVVDVGTDQPYSTPRAVHSGAHYVVNVSDEFNLESTPQEKDRCIRSNNFTSDWNDPTCRQVEM
ncbi:MAG: carbohydrate binding family 6, partial [Fibrobacteres bacterium]|nr:carbohydrate binding family 6 [Fibrobacterota bacterium]